MNIDETPEEKQVRLDAANRMHSYRQGWRRGAISFWKEKVFENHPNAEIREAYERGFADGHVAYLNAMDAAFTHYGHVPTVLRGNETPP